eukprot:511380-Rhodomonas_salina.2
MLGTDIVHAGICQRALYAMPGTDFTCAGICLRTSYAISSTDRGYAGICLRTWYAMSSAGRGFTGICLRACYAVSGTDMAYAPSPLRLPLHASTRSGSAGVFGDDAHIGGDDANTYDGRIRPSLDWVRQDQVSCFAFNFTPNPQKNSRDFRTLSTINSLSSEFRPALNACRSHIRWRFDPGRCSVGVRLHALKCLRAHPRVPLALRRANPCVNWVGLCSDPLLGPLFPSALISSAGSGVVSAAAQRVAGPVQVVGQTSHPV